MAEQDLAQGQDRGDAAEVAVGKRRGVSIVWLIPLIAAGVAGWLVYTTFAEKGPVIEISFKTAEGLEAGKTQLRLKDVEVGLVEEIHISNDLSHVVVTAQMEKELAPHLNTETRFWVVRPRLTASGVSGLGTLVSGAYIEVDPGEGRPERRFTGLEVPPVVLSDEPGREFLLTSDTLGSLSAGSPIHFRGIVVGEVLASELAEDNSRIDIRIFVKEPHFELIKPTTRFWNASGLRASVGTGGVQIEMESVQTLLSGGIAFETPASSAEEEPSPEGAVFRLFASRAEEEEEALQTRLPLLAYFEGSVRGLRIGAPVEFRGIRVGTVMDVSLEQSETLEFRIPVVFEIEPERVRAPGGGTHTSASYENIAKLVERGLRASLRHGNLLTGQLIVDLDFHPDAPPAVLRTGGLYPEVPVVPSELEQLTKSVSDALTEFSKLPLVELLADVRTTVQSVNELASAPELTNAIASLDASLRGVETLVAGLNENAVPLLASLRETSDATRDVAEQAQATLAMTDEMIGTDSMTRYNLTVLLSELAEASRSFRVFADYLEQHPEALVRGKSFDGR